MTGEAAPVAEQAGPAAGGRHRLAVRNLAAIGFLGLGLTVSIIGPALPDLRSDFGLRLGQVGLLTLVNNLGYLVSVLLGGLAADRWGRRPILLVGGLLMTGSSLAVMLAPSWPLVLLAGGLLGIGAGLIDGPINALINEHSGERRTSDLNLTHGLFGLGAVIGPLLAGGLLAVGLGWRWLFLPGGLLALALFGLTLRLRLGREVVQTAGGAPLTAVLGQPIVWLLALLLGLYVGVELTIGAWAFSHIRLSFGGDEAVAGLATALYWGGITLGRFLAGSLGSRLGPHQLIVGNLLAALAALALLVVAPTLALAVVGLALVGLALANVFPAVIAIAGARYPQATGAVSGLLIAAGGLGGALFPWLTGLLSEATGLGAALAGGLALLLLMLAVEVGLLRRLRPAG